MRAAAAAVAAGLALLGAGCGSNAATGGSGSDAASLVPPGALAFVHVDGNIDSDQWQVVEDLTGGLTMLRKEYGDIRPAIGDEVDFAVLEAKSGETETIALAHPEDEAKLRALAAKFDRESEHYTVEQVAGWSVVADSEDAFDSVRRAESGRSLADVDNFQSAMTAVEGDSLVTAYADAARLEDVLGELGGLSKISGARSWVAARVYAEGDAVRLSVHTDANEPVYRPRLLRDVPSGALLAVSFKDAQLLLKRLAPLPEELRELAPALRGEGVLYVTQGTLLPTLVLEIESPDPAAAARSLRRVAAQLSAKAGNLLALQVLTRGNRVYLTNALALPSVRGGRLVDDQPFKDALAAADAPEEVTWLAYADIHRLVPIVQALSQLLGGTALSPEQVKRLDRLDTLVAFGTRSGSTAWLELRLTIR